MPGGWEGHWQLLCAGRAGGDEGRCVRIRKKRESRAAERNLWEEGGGAKLEIRSVVTEKGKLKVSIWLGSAGSGGVQSYLPAGVLCKEEKAKGIELGWALLLRSFSGSAQTLSTVHDPRHSVHSPGP